MRQYKTISQLTGDQKAHLAWRLDHKTPCGYLTACRVSRGENGNLRLDEVFKAYGNCTPHAAKIHATKVEKYIK